MKDINRKDLMHNAVVQGKFVPHQLRLTAVASALLASLLVGCGGTTADGLNAVTGNTSTSGTVTTSAGTYRLAVEHGNKVDNSTYATANRVAYTVTVTDINGVPVANKVVSLQIAPRSFMKGRAVQNPDVSTPAVLDATGNVTTAATYSTTLGSWYIGEGSIGVDPNTGLQVTAHNRIDPLTNLPVASFRFTDPKSTTQNPLYSYKNITVTCNITANSTPSTFDSSAVFDSTGSVTASFATDAKGSIAFNIRYGKNYAWWSTVDLIASLDNTKAITQVVSLDTVATDTLHVPLGEDIANRVSPFGTDTSTCSNFL